MNTTTSRIRGPLPFLELDAAGAKLICEQGARIAVRDALQVLDERELADLTLFAQALDLPGMNARLRNIAGGALRGNRTDKAVAAKCCELAPGHTLALLTSRS